MAINNILKLAMRLGPYALRLLRRYGPLVKTWLKENDVNAKTLVHQLNKISHSFSLQRTSWKQGVQQRIEVVEEQVTELIKACKSEHKTRQITYYKHQLEDLHTATLLLDTTPGGMAKRRAQRNIEKQIDLLVSKVIEIYIEDIAQYRIEQEKIIEKTDVNKNENFRDKPYNSDI